MKKMKIIKPYIEILDAIDGEKIIKEIETIGRVCYKSEDKITNNSAKTFITNILQNGHHF